MSFANFDAEAQKGRRSNNNGSVPTGGGPTTESSNLLNKLSDGVTEFANNLNKFERNITNIGTQQDDRRLRTLLGTFYDNLSNVSTLLNNELVLKDAKAHNLDDKEKLVYVKVCAEFKRLNAKFTTIKNEYHEKLATLPQQKQQQDYDVVLQEEEAELAQRVAAGNNNNNNESTPLLGSQQQQQQRQQQDSTRLNERELQYHQYLIQQRSQDINQLSSGVEDINVIFKDLNSLIQQQGQQVDRVEDNLITYTNNNQFANQELIKADNYQRKKNRWCLFFLIAIIIIFVVILAIVS